MISIQEENTLSLKDYIFLLEDSGLGKRRPMENLELLQKMVDGANYWVTAREDGKLIGVLRGLSDRCYRCFIADLAVAKHFQKQGIGSRMVKFTRETNPGTRIFLFSAEDAEPFYQKLG
ncbi:MAG: GNAT family N-acetyltransferase, partial [Cyclobacteriaceae bacterium]|nr:GNAT family N-acetyltransferase [Cyclobacteriaceae bacterium]MDX5467720.1 GNAT family N-acetyltransferase [Cyclobacteriaceae bacterium]